MTKVNSPIILELFTVYYEEYRREVKAEITTNFLVFTDTIVFKGRKDRGDVRGVALQENLQLKGKIAV